MIDVITNGEIDFYACPNLPIVVSLLDIHATGLTFRVGAAVTAIAAALPSTSKPQKVHIKHKVEY